MADKGFNVPRVNTKTMKIGNASGMVILLVDIPLRVHDIRYKDEQTDMIALVSLFIDNLIFMSAPAICPAVTQLPFPFIPR